MEKYYRENYIRGISDINKDTDIHVMEWWAQDEEEDNDGSDISDRCKYCNKGDDYCKCKLEKYVIRCFGVDRVGKSVTCKITGYCPEFYIKVKSDFDKIKLHNFLEWVSASYYSKLYPMALVRNKCKIVKRKDIYGFTNNKEYTFIKLVFNNYTALKKMRYLFKKPVMIPKINNTQVKYKLYESNFEGFLRFGHIKDIYMAGWIRLPSGEYEITESEANTQLEYIIDYNKIESLKECKDMGNFLQASFDIETYSYDMNFPDPNRVFKINGKNVKPNEIFQIATTFKYYKEQDILVKHLLTLKKCANIDDPGVIIEECNNERELIKRWCDIIYNMDPDILYTYNGDRFDCKYIIERAKIYNIQEYVFNRLSRLQYTSSYVKLETFSSSAYGDSDYYRLYIPGRLNYDLLIHYQRGIKKYPSYRLDYIANEIIGEGKHDLDAKTMFQYYYDGTPEKIRTIAEYCIVDTSLLQKLVDKQLILINIMQLANVTYVPMKYLTTKGQTIKAFSQLLRKAKQMNFLVPDTNFNEDAYPITIKFNESHHFEESDIGEYIKFKNLNTATKTRINTDVNCKISEILDEFTIIVVSDYELEHEYYNKTLTYRYNSYKTAKIFPNDEEINDTFSGAYVLQADKNLHSDNVCILDFASLYPTIMIAWNLCYSTFVRDSKFLGIDGVKYERLQWDDKVSYKMKHTCENLMKSGKRKGEVCGKQAYFEVEGQYVCRIHDALKKERGEDEKEAKKDISYDYTIVQPMTTPDGTVINKGVLPALLEELYAERKNVKRQMAIAKANGDTLLENILDHTQLSIKISLNSCYGFLGRKQGNLVLKELGSIVTSNGRKLLDKSKNFAENGFLNYIKDNKLTNITLKEIELCDDFDKTAFLQKYIVKQI